MEQIISKDPKNKAILIGIAAGIIAAIVVLAIFFGGSLISKKIIPIPDDQAKSLVEPWRRALESLANQRGFHLSTAFNFKLDQQSMNALDDLERSLSTAKWAIIETSEVTVKRELDKTYVSLKETILSDVYSHFGERVFEIGRDGSALVIRSILFNPLPPQQNLTSSEVENFIENWRTAWEYSVQGKKIDAYRNCYSPKFYSHYKSMNYDQYMNYRLGVGERAALAKIEVDKATLRGQLVGNRAIYSFDQSYQTDRYGDRGKKMLIIEKQPEGLKIIGEEFTRYEKLPKLTPLFIQWWTNH
jgi:hypothetical protein